jgi:hypothetical protein
MESSDLQSQETQRLGPVSHSAPVPLPDGREKIPLGSGVITRLLGHGGMAAVYEIWNQELEMFRAVKIINPGSADVQLQRFQTEIKISAKLKHPNIIEIHGVGEWHGLPFIEMEKVEGVALDEIIRERGALPAVVCTSIGIMICRALSYAHKQECTIYGRSYLGVIHRDLKPGNIMISSNGIAKLMDFGIARPVDVSFETLDGLVSGTLPYLAPEQLEKKKLDVRTDLYALGTTMYEIVCGTVAFPQSSFAQLVSFKTKSKYKPLEAFSIKLPPELKRLIYKCMYQDPQKRYANTEILRRELEKIHGKLTSKSPEEIVALAMASVPGKKLVLSLRRRFPWTALAILACSCMLGVFGYRYGIPIARNFLSNQVAVPSLRHQVFVAQVPEQKRTSEPARGATVQTPGTSRKVKMNQPAPVHSDDSKGKTVLISRAPSAKNAAEGDNASALELLKNKYGTNDVLEIAGKELTARNFSNVIRVCDGLPPDLARSSRAIILKMHAIEGVGTISLLANFFQSTYVNDGEYLLGKAKFSYRKKDLEASEKLLTQSLKTPHAFIEYELLKREVYYYTGLCATARFDANPSDLTYKNALDAWWQLRTMLRSDPGNEYNVRANAELQRMGKKMQKG